MKQKHSLRRIILGFITGLGLGLLAASGFSYAATHLGAPNLGVLALVTCPLLIMAGFALGHDVKSEQTFRAGHLRGWIASEIRRKPIVIKGSDILKKG